MKLSDFELDVMQIFWQQGICSSPEIFKQIEQVKNVTYSTVKTIIDRLEDKGALKRDRIEDRAIYYVPAVTQSEITQTVLPGFLRRFFNGKATDLITHLMKDEELSQDDIAYLEVFLKKQKEKNQD
ncbi:BlaI/MecI/CopY family transcriptional regulator [Rheinheimera metallidurans]|uniref:BlaI/MecI/CopY family transcriptional regulator n=1 Tax=Rheinheimera metallidurans TaxID=2925781 RepID=UPI003002554A